MRHCLPFALILAAPVAAAPLEPESRAPYQLRVVVRTGDHPTLTRHFRTDVLKSVTSALQAALGPAGSVEAIDLNATPADKRDPLWALVDEKGLEALDAVNVAAGPKTHFVFVNFADGKYEIRTRQHDGSTGFSSPFVRKQVHGDRGFVARLAGLAVAQDFGVVGTFDPSGPQVSVVLKAGELGPLDAFVKTGDVFAVVQVREGRRAVAPRKPKGKEIEPAPAPPAMTGTRIDGVLLHLIDGPRNGLCVCRMYNRFKTLPQRDGLTVGYRCVRLGTGEGPLRLLLTDAAGTPYRADAMQPRAGAQDFPDPAVDRNREEMRFADGVFATKESFRNIAFVLVRSGETPVARLPVEIYPDQVAVRKVNPNPAAELSPVQAAAADLLDRARSARVIQARCFDEVAILQKKDKPKALAYGQEAATSLDNEADVLRADLEKAKTRYKADAAPGQFDATAAELRTLEATTRKLREHLGRLKDAIRIENDPAALALRKKVNDLLLESRTSAQQLDMDAAIAKCEEALNLVEREPVARAEIEKELADLRRRWGPPRDVAHAAARKFAYEAWPKVETPAQMLDALPEARRALAACKAAGDRVTILKMFNVAPDVGKKYLEALKAMRDMAVEDEDKQALAAYEKVSRDLEAFIGELTKEVGAEAGK